MVGDPVPHLAPSGTRLADLPAEWRGLSWQAWDEARWAEWRAAAEAARSGSAAALAGALATPRDRYGWRSLPAGSRYIGNR